MFGVSCPEFYVRSLMREAWRSKLDQLASRSGQDFRSARRHQRVVFDADTAGALDVDARLDGDYVPGLQARLLVAGDARALVNFEADAVARAVHEVAAQALL